MNRRRLVLALVVAALPCFAPRAGAPFAASSDWPGWAGASRDFHVEDPGLATSWPEDGPAVLWSRFLGPGHSAVVSSGSRLFTMYRDGDDEVVVALSVASGETIWEHRYAAPTYERNQLRFGQGPNATPAVVGTTLVTVGYTGIASGIDARTGRARWSVDLIRDLGGQVQRFGYSASPLIHDGKVVVLVGGERAGAVALDPADGSVAWTGPPTSISYASPKIVRLAGRDQLMYFGRDELIALSPSDGALLWRWPVANSYQNHAHDVLIGADDVVWVVTQTDGAGRGLKVVAAGDGFDVSQAWTSPRVQIHYWNAVERDGVVYASLGSDGALFSAIDSSRGTILWRERGLRRAKSILAGDLLIALDEDGRLWLARPTRDGLDRLAETRIDTDLARTPPSLVGTTLLFRDHERVVALDLGRPVAVPKKAPETKSSGDSGASP